MASSSTADSALSTATPETGAMELLQHSDHAAALIQGRFRHSQRQRFSENNPSSIALAVDSDEVTCSSGESFRLAGGAAFGAAALLSAGAVAGGAVAATRPNGPSGTIDTSPGIDQTASQDSSCSSSSHNDSQGSLMVAADPIDSGSKKGGDLPDVTEATDREEDEDGFDKDDALDKEDKPPEKRSGRYLWGVAAAAGTLIGATIVGGLLKGAPLDEDDAIAAAAIAKGSGGGAGGAGAGAGGAGAGAGGAATATSAQ